MGHSKGDCGGGREDGRGNDTCREDRRTRDRKKTTHWVTDKKIKRRGGSMETQAVGKGRGQAMLGKEGRVTKGDKH